MQAVLWANVKGGQIIFDIVNYKVLTFKTSPVEGPLV